MLLSPLRRSWEAWSRWRRRRPFSGGLLIILAGIEMVLIAGLPVELMVYLGVGSVSTLLFAGMLVVLGLITWCTPNQHVITGSLAGFVALGALVLSNLGGLVIGTLLALAGGGLAFAWRPVARPPRRKRGRRGKGEASRTRRARETVPLPPFEP